MAPRLPGETTKTSSSSVPSRSVKDQHALEEARRNATPGQYWISNKNGEDCPVVICDEDMMVRYFTERLGHNGALKKVHPCLYAGTLDCLWTSSENMRPFSIKCARHMQLTTTNATLAAAWQEVSEQIELCGEKSNMAYWKDKLQAKGLQERVNYNTGAWDDGSGGSWPQKGGRKSTKERKRKRTPNRRYPPGYGPDEEVDDEESDSFLSAPRIKNEFGNGDEDMAFSGYLTPSYSTDISKRSRLNSAGRLTARLGTPFDGYRSQFSTPLRGIALAGTPSRTIKQENDIDLNTVQIFVGDPHTLYRVRRQGLDASPLLSSLLVNNAESGYYVMSPLLSSLNGQDFLPIAEYFERQEYSPNIIDVGTDWVRFEIGFTPEERGHEIIRSGIIYNLAKTLEMVDLQGLTFEKLKTLIGFDEVFPLIAILTIVEHVFGNANEDLRQYLIRVVADTYWPLVMAETAKMAEVMQGCQDLAKGVFTRLSELATPGGNVMKEEETKSEDALESDIEIKKEVGKENIISDVEKAQMQKALETSELEKTSEDMNLQRALQQSLQEQQGQPLESF